MNINTNLSSLIVQSSFKASALGLNNAIERMTSGYKLNHAKDNAANYGIVTNLTTKLDAYQTAEDNTLQALDMLQVATGTLSGLSDMASRLRNLAIQVQNGTYGSKSLAALNKEALSLTNELFRLSTSAEYGGVKLFGEHRRIDIERIKTPDTTGFMEPIERVDTSSLKTLAGVDENSTLNGGTYSISSAEELAKLSRMSNDGKFFGTTFVLAADIDLSAYSSGEGWIPIAINQISINGNGYTISNLYINRPNADNQGLISNASTQYMIGVKNLRVVNADVTGHDSVGIIAGRNGGDIENCSVEGTVTGNDSVGGITGYSYKLTNSCYADVRVKGNTAVGGIAGQGVHGINSCYFAGKVEGVKNVGGIAGSVSGSPVPKFENNTAAGDVLGEMSVGGAFGYTGTTISSNIALGNVEGKSNVGGFVGTGYASTYANNISMSNVIGETMVGGFIGRTSHACTFNDDVSQGNVKGDSKVGGFIGSAAANTALANFYTSSRVQGNAEVGSVAGYARSVSDSSYVGTKNTGLSICGNTMATVTNVVDISKNTNKTLQVGINSSDSSTLDINTFFDMDSLLKLTAMGIESPEIIDALDDFIASINSKQTEFGAVENRLESVLEEISIKYENLLSSRSTLQDADISEVSSEYIRNQILQQASATLMATANQTPAIALQLL